MLGFKPAPLFKRCSSFLQQRLCSSLLWSHQRSDFNYLSYLLSNHISSLVTLLQSHAFIITSGYSSNIFIASKLISLYASFDKLSSSTQVFDEIPQGDTFLWNSIIKAHFSCGEYCGALDFYRWMMASEALPNHFTIPMIVASCGELELIDYGRGTHGLVSKRGLFAGNSVVGSSFVYMYSKCGVLGEAYAVFDEILFRDVIAWTALVIGCVQNGESKMGLKCLCEMHTSGGDGERPNFRTLEGGFQACGNLGALLEGRCLHGFVVKTGMDRFRAVQSSLLLMYSKCGDPEEAQHAFCEVVNKDLISWTSMISSYLRIGWATECLDMFWKMLVSGIYPDGIVISHMLYSFTNSMRVFEGKAFHGFIIRREYILDQMVQNALLSMYCKFGCLKFAEKLLGRVNEQNFEAWNLMVSAYGKVGLAMKCVKLFRQMQYLGIESDSNSLISVISSCSQLEANLLAQSIHCYMTKKFMDENVSANNLLIDMYGKSGNLTVASRIFGRTPRDVVTWNTLISCYTHCGHFVEALSLYDKMISEDLKPNSTTLVTVLSACSHLASLEEGKKVHNYINEEKFDFNLSVATALIDMYAKCGQVQKSRDIFNSMHERDVIAWNVMISGYGMHGDAISAIEIFHQMEKSNAKPDELTFLAVLSACAHAGLVEEGKYLFGKMRDYSVSPDLKHYACMVDLLGRSGNLQEAEALVFSMPITPDGGIWGALLSSCKTHNEIEMGIRIAKHAIASDVKNDGYYVMMSNMFSSVGKWEEAEKARGMMKERGVRKRAGWSAVQLIKKWPSTGDGDVLPLQLLTACN